MDYGVDGSTLTQAEKDSVTNLTTNSLDRLRSGSYDTEPDVFFYNFGPYSGQFVLPPDLLDANDQVDNSVIIQTIPHSNLKIEVNNLDNYGIISWSITDENGIKYTFDKDEIHIQTGVSGLISGAQSGSVVQNRISWYLTKIEFPNSSDTIDLYYTDQETAYYYNRSVSFSDDGVSTPDYSSYPTFVGYTPVTFFKTAVNNTQSVHKVRRLSRIESNSHILYFDTNTSPDRYDAPIFISYDDTYDYTDYSDFPLGLQAQEYKLLGIRLCHKISSGCEEVRRWNFNYDYFNEDVSLLLGHTNLVNEPDLFKRLKLNSVDIADPNDNALETYSFEYNETGFPFKYYNYNTNAFVTTTVNVTLPAYLDFVQGVGGDINPTVFPAKYPSAVDHWGYFNNEFENHPFSIPQTDYLGMTGPDDVIRQPDEAAMKSGMLSKIYYPTGGYTEFTFEANQYDAVGSSSLSSNKTAGGLRIKKIESVSHSGATPIVKSYSYTVGVTTGSSGALVIEPTYQIPYLNSQIGGEYDITYGLLDHSLIPLGTTLGGIVGYNEVKVTHGATGEYGYEVSTFTSPEDYPDEVLETAIVDLFLQTFSGSTLEELNWGWMEYYKKYMDPNDYYLDTVSNFDWGFGYRSSMDSRRGLLLTHSVYNSSDQLLQKTVNEYYDSIVEDESTSPTHNRYLGISTTNAEDLDQVGITMNYPQTFLIKYEHISSWNFLKKQEVTIYDPASQGSELTTTTRFEYDEDHLQLTKEVRTNSDDQDSVATEYEYAHTINRSGINYTAMEGLNLLSYPYSVTVKNANSNAVLSKKWLKWSTSITGATGNWMPSEYWVWDTGTTPDDPGSTTSINTFKINEYDSYGNVLEVEDALDDETKYYYGNNTSPFSNTGINGVSGKYLTGIQKGFNGLDGSACSSDDFCTSAAYDALGRINSTTNENSNSVGFGYDEFGRLKTNFSPLSAELMNKYYYSISGNGGSYSATDPNYVSQIMMVDGLEEPEEAQSQPVVFDGDNDYVSLGDVSFMDNASAFSVSLWFKRYSDAAGTSLDTNHLINNVLVAQSSSASNDNLEIGTEGTDIEIYLDTGSGTEDTRRAVDAGITNNVLYHLVLTYSASADQTKLYLDGELIQTWTEWKNALANSGSSPLSLGIARPTDEAWGDLEGFIADFRLYDRTLSSTEVTSLFEGIETVSYLDGLGREVQTQQRGGSESIISGMEYDARSIPEAVSRPFIKSNQSTFLNDLFGPTFSAPGTVFWDSDLDNYYDGTSGGANYPYTYNNHEDSPLARTIETRMPGGSAYDVNTSYGLNTTETFTINGKTWAVNTLNKVVVEDPDGKKTITYTDGWGRTIASGVDMDGDGALDGQTKTTCSDPTPPALPTCDLITEFEYDLRGNLIRVEDPRNLPTTYTYDELGRLVEKKLTDQTDSHEYRYDDKGRLRFHKDPALNAVSDHYYYTKYDDLDRPTEIGKRNTSADFSDEADINDQDFPYFSYTQYIKYHYDGTNLAPGAQNLEGRITRVDYQDLSNLGNWGYTWYSYNDLGLVEWIEKRLPGQSSSHDKTIYYTYDELGRTTRVFFDSQTTGEDFYFWYEYDELGRLQYVNSNEYSDPATAVREAEYVYFADGSVKQVKLGPAGDLAQTLDYTYRVQGWLDKINNGSVSTSAGGDRFSLALNYNNSGNISKQTWKQSAISTSGVTYDYSYDNANRLAEACYGGASCNSSNYDVAYEYDRNGNLEKIERFPNSTSSDVINHVYVNNTNKLLTVILNGPNNDFSHDANGNVTQNDLQNITSISYDWRNLPDQTVTSSGTLKFAYDSDGNRVKKELVGGTTTWYVRGAAGEIIAVYEGSNLSYWVLPGGLGIINY